MTARAPDWTDIAAEKAAWRRRIRAARRARDPEVRARHAELLTEAALELAGEIGGPICAHLPVGVEPWSPSGVEALRAAGHEVLLPVVADRAGPLDWSRFDGLDALVSGPFGLWEPAGVRLGQGGGFYDRTLPLVPADIALVVVLDDGELVDELPAEPHDRRVTAALLPESGVTMLGQTD